MVFCLYLLFPESRKNFTDKTATKRDLYRYIRDTCKISIKDFFIPQIDSKNITDNDILSKYFTENTLHVHFKLLGGPTITNPEKLEIHIDIPHPLSHQSQIISANQNNKISSILYEISEKLDTMARMDYTWKDFELVYKNEILHPDNLLAMYPELSRSFISFINPNVLKEGILSKLVDYYEYKVLGSRSIEDIPKLIFRFKTKEHENIKHRCNICKKNAISHNIVILPRCRDIYCYECIDNHVNKGHNKCVKCDECI